MYFEDTVTYFDKIVMFSHREANRCTEIYPAIIVVKWGLNALSLYCRTQNTLFRYYLLCWGFFTLNSNKFRMVYKVDGNSQLDSRDWSMYSNILKQNFQLHISFINNFSKPRYTSFECSKASRPASKFWYVKTTLRLRYACNVFCIQWMCA